MKREFVQAFNVYIVGFYRDCSKISGSSAPHLGQFVGIGQITTSSYTYPHFLHLHFNLMFFPLTY